MVAASETRGLTTDRKYSLPVGSHRKGGLQQLASNSCQEKLHFACPRHSCLWFFFGWLFGVFSFPKRQSVSFTSSSFHSHFSCQEGGREKKLEKRYLWIPRVKTHALWEMFTRVQTREPLRTKLFSLCLSPHPLIPSAVMHSEN